MTARQRRLTSDYEQVKKTFSDHKNIIVTPVGDDDIPEKYHVTYFVNGIYLNPDGSIETLGRHEVDITLHADYPRYKPICTISTPIWHPNFRDGQICIGDIWGAGESLSDIIINIGDMIQYKSWNSASPLSADAAKWAIENKHLFPVGTVELNVADYSAGADAVKIDLSEPKKEARGADLKDSAAVKDEAPFPDAPAVPAGPVNDFEITAEELAGIEYVPSAQRMQTFSKNGLVKGNRVNLKTVLVKGVLWAVIGALLGFLFTELTDGLTAGHHIARIMGYGNYAEYLEYDERADKEFEKISKAFEAYCRRTGQDSDDTALFKKWMNSDEFTDDLSRVAEKYNELDDRSDEAFHDAFLYDFDSDADAVEKVAKRVARIGTGLWSAGVALMIGLFLGIGEGVFYGSKDHALRYGLIGAGISTVLGFISGDLAQLMYAAVIDSDASLFTQSSVRGLGWSIMGIGVGLAVGLIKPEPRRLLFCGAGGLIGALLGGFLFNYIFELIPNNLAARGAAILVMGILIGVGVGLLEQFAKAAWLKVIRGEFEGKEYLVFAGTTSIGNNSKNTIVLFKDKLVGPHHCDIKLEGSKYVLTDCGTPMGTVVNGSRVDKHILKAGDAIAIGNSVLVFNTK